MLKHLYKTLLVSVISCSLVTMNMTAFAAGTATRGADGVMTVTESHQFEAADADYRDDVGLNALEIITMLAIGVIGMKLLLYEKWTGDMQLAAIGSAAYIGSEIVALTKFDDKLEEKSKEITKRADGKDDQNQIKYLQDLKASYEKVVDTSEKKMVLQLAAAAAFGAAGIFASIRVGLENFEYGKCETGLQTARRTLDSCIEAGAAGATPLSAAEGIACAACEAKLTAIEGQLAAYKIDREVPGPSFLKFSAITPQLTAITTGLAVPCPGVTAAFAASAVAAVITPAVIQDASNHAGGTAPTLGDSNIPNSNLEKLLFAKANVNDKPKKMSLDYNINLRNVLSKMLDSIFPKAEAGITAMFGLGAGAAAVFFAQKTTFSNYIDTIIFSPAGRQIAWYTMGAAASGASIATNNEIHNAKTIVRKIDKIISDLETLKAGVKIQEKEEQYIMPYNFPLGFDQDVKPNPDPSVKTDCLTGGGNTNCPPLPDNFKGMPGFSDLPDSFKSIVSQTVKVGNGLGGKNSFSAETLSNASALGGKLGAITKLKKSIQTKINNDLKKRGKPTIDFDKNGKNLWANLKSKTADILKSKNMSPGTFLAGTGLSPISDAGAAVAKMPTENKKAMPSGATALPASAGAKEKGLDFDFKETPAAQAAAVASGDSAHNEKFDIGTNDISTNSSESIFQLISNRYLKSGYPKLLDEIPAAVPVPAKK